uniref:RteC protein n=4 Tax=unclassified Prevotella TaxID=2638335 RepID=A0AB33JQ76_9BACT
MNEFYPNNQRQQDEAERKDRMNKAIGQLGKEMEQLLKLTPEHKNYYWKGTTTDLIEMVYDTYMMCELRDRRGCPFTFKHMIHHVCSVLHVYEPRNPRAYVHRARMRKEVRQTAFLDRYAALMRHDSNPMKSLIGRVSGRD